MRQAFKSLDPKSPLQIPTLRSQSASVASNLAEKSSPNLSEQLHGAVARNVGRKCAKLPYEFTQQATKHAPSSFFITGTAKIEEGMIKAPMVISKL